MRSAALTISTPGQDALHLVGRTIAIVKQRREQWRGRWNGAAALRERERSVLVRHELRQETMSAKDAVGDAGFIDVEANGQRVDEHADHAIGARAAAHASEKHSAEDYSWIYRRLDAKTVAQAIWKRAGGRNA